MMHQNQNFPTLQLILICHTCGFALLITKLYHLMKFLFYVLMQITIILIWPNFTLYIV
jgi:hypothetical protein